MWACLFRGQGVDKVRTDWLEDHLDILRSTCKAYVRAHGFAPHPAVLLMEVQAQLKTTSHK